MLSGAIEESRLARVRGGLKSIKEGKGREVPGRILWAYLSFNLLLRGQGGWPRTVGHDFIVL